MADPVLSKPYSSSPEAAMGGFNRILLSMRDWETKEYAFFVVLVPKDKKTSYHYTYPETSDESQGVTVTVPAQHMLRAYCHTHPKSIATGNFSSNDKASFLKLKKQMPNVQVDWYLMTAQGALRLATTEKDFPAGRVLSLKSVGP